MKSFVNLSLILVSILLFSCRFTTTFDTQQTKGEIMAVLNAQVAAWNRGDIETYMEGYARSDSLRFASGGRVSYGWQTTLQRYSTGYPDRVAMGILTFSDIDIQIVSRDAALVFGKWELLKVDETPWGLFTLLLRKSEEGWHIVHDHTSAAKD
jgi:ketosteroid isomerase-like protein